MKLAVLSDIHGNLPALQAVAAHIEAWKADRVLVAGDMVNRGPSSPDCLQLIRERGWQMILGNHEEYVLAQAGPEAPRSGPRFEIFRPSLWTYQQLDGQVAELATLPAKIVLEAPDGSEVQIYHASRQGTRVGIWPHSSLEQIRQRIDPAPSLFITGHIHRPFVRPVDQTLIVNAGSAGSPCDGDRRASYAQIEWRDGWQARVIRVAYDMDRTKRDFFESGFFPGCGTIGQLFYHEWRTARMVLPVWLSQYELPVLAGEMTVEESVARFMAETGLEN